MGWAFQIQSKVCQRIEEDDGHQVLCGAINDRSISVIALHDFCINEVNLLFLQLHVDLGLITGWSSGGILENRKYKLSYMKLNTEY